MPSLCRAKEGCCAAGSARAPTTICSRTAVDLFSNLPVSRFLRIADELGPGTRLFQLMPRYDACFSHTARRKMWEACLHASVLVEWHATAR